MAFFLEPGRHPENPVKGCPGVWLVDQPHQVPRLLRDWSRRPIQTGSVHAQKLTLTPDADRRTLRVDQASPKGEILFRVFFQPVQFDLPLSDLAVEFFPESFFGSMALFHLVRKTSASSATACFFQRTTWLTCNPN